MGNSQPHPRLSRYSESTHPIFGQIIAYAIKGQAAKFIMQTKMSLTLQRKLLFQKIGEDNFQKMLTYYGVNGGNFARKLQAVNVESNVGQQKNITMKNRSVSTHASSNSNENKFNSNTLTNTNPQKSPQSQYIVYWQYLNYNLESYIKDLKQSQSQTPQPPSSSSSSTPPPPSSSSSSSYTPQQLIWQLLDNMLLCCQHLKKFNIYPELTSRYIYFSAGKEPKLHWCNIQQNNTHLAYQRYIRYKEFRHTVYAPEELLEMSRIQRKQLDKQKSTLFVLGILVLELITKCDIRRIYDYKGKTFSQVRKRQLLSMIDGNLTNNNNKDRSRSIKKSLSNYSNKNSITQRSNNDNSITNSQTHTSFNQNQSTSHLFPNRQNSISSETNIQPSSLSTSMNLIPRSFPDNPELKHKYSQQLILLLYGLLQYFPKDRYNYEILHYKLDRHYRRNCFDLAYNTGDPLRITFGVEKNNGGDADNVQSQDKLIDDDKNKKKYTTESINLQCFKTSSSKKQKLSKIETQQKLKEAPMHTSKSKSKSKSKPSAQDTNPNKQKSPNMPTNTALNQSLETDTNLPNGNVNGKKIGSFRSFDANF